MTPREPFHGTVLDGPPGAPGGPGPGGGGAPPGGAGADPKAPDSAGQPPGAAGPPKWWSCKGAGCNPIGNAYGDKTEGECGESGLGCECTGAEPPSSGLVCVPDVDENGKSIKVLHSKNPVKSKRVKKPIVLVKPGKIPKIIGSASPESAGDCDWNPFTNLPYVMFRVSIQLVSLKLQCGWLDAHINVQQRSIT